MQIAGLDLSISSSGVVIYTLDNLFEITDVKYYGFTTKKKLEAENIIYYNNKQFKNNYDKYSWMADYICEWCKDCEYIAVEDYAYGKSGTVRNDI